MALSGLHQGFSLVRVLSSSLYTFMIGKNFRIYIQFLDYWRTHLWNSPTLCTISSLIWKIFPPSVIKIIYKKVLPCFFGGRHYALAPLQNHVGVYTPSTFARKCGLKLVNILNLAKRIIWQIWSVGWGIIEDLESC